MESSIILTPALYKKKLESTIPKLTHASGNLTMAQFFELMFYTLDIEKPGLVFAPAWPQYLVPSTPEYKKTMENPTDMWMDTVTYMVTREEPGSVGGDKQPFGGRREVVPRFRENKNFVADGKSLQVYGQWFDVLLQFDLWTLTNWESENLKVWFKRFMMTHRNFFKDMGLSDILFWWGGRDNVSSQLNNLLHLRTVVYWLRTEELSTETDFNLQELKIKLKSIME